MARNPAAENVCFSKGHYFESMEEGKPFVDPTSKMILRPEAVIRCRQCGMTPEASFRYELKPKGNAKLNASRREGNPGPSDSPAD